MKLACAFAALLPAASGAQVSYSPLPPVPAVEPLYASAAPRWRPAAVVPSVRLASLPRRFEPVPVTPTVMPERAPVAPPVSLASLSPRIEPVPVTPPVPTVVPEPAVAHASITLAPNAEVALRLDEEVNSDGREVGSVFRLTVARDVAVDGSTVIPAGTPAFGKVTWRTGKGMFGRSGKIAISIDRLQLAERTFPLLGEFRETGRGRTGLTIGITVAAGIVAGAFVKGEEAAFHAGRELLVKTGAPIEASVHLRPTPKEVVSLGTAAAR